MRKVHLKELDEKINENRSAANHIIRMNSDSRRRVKKSRPRTPGEVKALNEISIARWQDAIDKGKIKKIGERSMYYDYRE